MPLEVVHLLEGRGLSWTTTESSVEALSVSREYDIPPVRPLRACLVATRAMSLLTANTVAYSGVIATFKFTDYAVACSNTNIKSSTARFRKRK